MKNYDFLKGIANKEITFGKNGSLSVRDGLVYSFNTVVADLRVANTTILPIYTDEQKMDNRHLADSRIVKAMDIESTLAGRRVEYLGFQEYFDSSKS